MDNEIELTDGMIDRLDIIENAACRILVSIAKEGVTDSIREDLSLITEQDIEDEVFDAIRDNLSSVVKEIQEQESLVILLEQDFWDIGPIREVLEAIIGCLDLFKINVCDPYISYEEAKEVICYMDKECIRAEKCPYK